MLTTALPDLCNRRRWADPLFETRSSRHGWTCCVCVNNREYTCDTAYTTEERARDKAAECAYMICRNFSVNDGMYPGQGQGQVGVLQGLPVAIGTGRRNRHKNDSESTNCYYGSSNDNTSARIRDTISTSTNAVSLAAGTLCNCGRAYVSLHGQCGFCI